MDRAVVVFVFLFGLLVFFVVVESSPPGGYRSFFVFFFKWIFFVLFGTKKGSNLEETRLLLRAIHF